MSKNPYLLTFLAAVVLIGVLEVVIIVKWVQDLQSRYRRSMTSHYSNLTPVAAPSEPPLDFQLQQACASGDVKQATDLLARGAAIDGSDVQGYTPLILAAANGQTDMVRLLLDKGAKIDFQTKGSTALEEACGHDRFDVAKLLIDRGAICTHVDKNTDREQTPMHGAARTGDIPLLTILLNHGVDINYANDYGTALNSAITGEQWDAFEFLISKGADPNIPGVGEWGGFPPLLVMAHSPDSESIRYSVKLLLKAGADPNYRSKRWDGMTALMCTGNHGLVQVAQALIDAGADVNASQYQSKETALTMAGDHGFADLVELLKKNGARRTDLHIIGHEKPNPMPSPARLWALAVGAMYVQKNGYDPYLLGEWSYRTPTDIQRDIELSWGITDAAGLRDKVTYLRVTGDRAALQKEGAQWAAMSDTEFNSHLSSLSSDPQKQAHLQAARKSYLKWKDRSGLGMDLCASVNLINHGYSANYLSEQDAWNLLILVARDAQKNFSSWQELGENFLDSRELVKGVRDPNFALCVQLLSNTKDPNSVWNQCPWDTDLSKEN